MSGLAILAILYWFPSVVALLRGHNFGGVLIVNTLLGWTLVGWAVALVMACGSNGRRRARA